MSAWMTREWTARFGRPQPEKIVCVGLNYRDHAAEQHVALPEEPVLFGKFANTLAGDGDVIAVPAGIGHLDAEAELTVVIGREAKDVDPAAALDHVAGITCGNDLSARDLQFKDAQVLRAKGFDGFCPVGPRLVPLHELPAPLDRLRIVQRLNGTTLQDSSTGQLVFDVPHLIAYVTRVMTLQPGDLLLTGTPAGVGVFRDPPVSLGDGDEVEVEIEGVGVLRNRIAVVG